MLDPDARKELRTLSRETSDLVARHLVVTGQLLDEEPEQALAHARAARALAGRVGIVREAAGLAAYAAGEWAEALSDLRAARRITGEAAHLAVCADCERALGRPERALVYGDDPEVAGLPQDQRVELIIVLAGARRDLGQRDAAVLVLQEPSRRTTDKRPWAARLWYAFADALLDAGRQAEAEEWFGRAAAVDLDGGTDAGDRLLALQGVVLEDPEDALEDERDDLPTADELAELVRDLPVSATPDPEEPVTSDSGQAPLAPAARSSAAREQEPAAAARTIGSARPDSAGSSQPAGAGAGTGSGLTVPPSVPLTGLSGGSDQGSAPVDGVAEGTARGGSADEPAPVVPARARVAPPTFVAPPSADEADSGLRLFERASQREPTRPD